MPITPIECRNEIIQRGWTVTEIQRNNSWEVVARGKDSSLICVGVRRSTVWRGALDGVQRMQAEQSPPTRLTERSQPTPR